MSISVTELISGIESKNGFPLDPEQKRAIANGDGPLLIAAGPGTGKTEVLVTRCLKFICCNGVTPGSILMTTFTEKAAKNLQDRLSEAFLFLVGKYPQLSTIDPSDLRIGTLHGLCNDILQEYRYINYQNLRLLNDIESSLLIHKHVVNQVQHLKRTIFNQFNYLFHNNKRFEFLNKWEWSFALKTIFDRLIEDQIDLNSLESNGGPWDAIHYANQIYEQELSRKRACDFSRLLQHFLNFLNSVQGASFITGDGTVIRLPLTHILVDEYQDTNPIQESIYFRLSESGLHNITVVGDDDQALYRFRGGTVECMVGFPEACRIKWNIDPNIVYLSANHRSDSEIVDWCNNYITSFPQMNLNNVRIQGKPLLSSSRGRTGSHSAVSLIRSNTLTNSASSMANLITELRSNNIIQDYSQCVLLLRSTKNSSRYAGPYIDALELRGVPIYNPRSKDFLEQEEVAQCLGAFIRIIDPDLQQIDNIISPSIQDLVQGWIDQFDILATSFPELHDYTTRGANEITQKRTSERITPAVPTILYRILSHQPFINYQTNPERDLRLSKLTKLFESFCAQYGRQLWTDDNNAGQLPSRWYGNFYHGLCGYLAYKGLDDDEDEEVVCPTGFFPIMTVHQAKGLEFDFVFVGNLGASVSVNSAHQLEQDFTNYRFNQPTVMHSINESMWHDDIRQHFVAYSRAKYSLILIASDSQLRKSASETASFGASGGGWVRQNILRL